MDKIIVSAAGIIGIAAIYWFFFGKKSGEARSGSAREAKNSWDITVDGGYKPNTITIHQGQVATLTFTRRDANSCLEELVFPDYKIKEYLPMNKPVTITLYPTQKGTSVFHCAMNMFHGRIEIV